MTTETQDIDMVTEIDIAAIKVLKGFNVRSKLPDMVELTANIKQNGVLQPVILVKGKGIIYELVDGHRRLEAAKGAGLKSVPAIIYDELDATERLSIMGSTGTNGAPLTPLELGTLAERMLPELKTNDAIAKALALTPARIGQVRKLLTAPAAVQKLIQDGAVSAKAVYTLLAKGYSDDDLLKLLKGEPLEEGGGGGGGGGGKRGGKRGKGSNRPCRSIEWNGHDAPLTGLRLVITLPKSCAVGSTNKHSAILKAHNLTAMLQEIVTAYAKSPKQMEAGKKAAERLAKARKAKAPQA